MPFIRMSAKELSDITDEDPEVLSHEEQIILFKYITESTNTRLDALLSLGFDLKHTKSYISSNRFLSAPLCTNSESCSPYSLGFTVNKSVKFVGITMYGMNVSGSSDNVRLELYNDVTTASLSDTTKQMTYTGTDEPIQFKADNPVMLSADVKYRVVLHTSKFGAASRYYCATYYYGLPSTRGDIAGVTFTFSNVDNHVYPNTTQGQIPQIMFAC